MSAQPQSNPLRARTAGWRTYRSACVRAVTVCSRLAAASTLLAAAFSGTASAAVVTFSTAFDIATDYTGQMVGGISDGGAFDVDRFTLQLADLSRFDTTLGTLTGVTFGFYSTVELDLQGSARDVNPGRVAEVETSLQAELAVDLALSLFDPSLASDYAVARRIEDSCSARGGLEGARCDVSRNQVLGLSNELNLASLALSDFVGTDPINFFVSMNTNLSGACQDDLGDDCQFAETGARWSGVATVAYTYDAIGGPGGGTGGGGTGGGGGAGNAVPEPASGWLAGLALVGLAANGSRRRQDPRG